MVKVTKEYTIMLGANQIYGDRITTSSQYHYLWLGDRIAMAIDKKYKLKYSFYSTYTYWFRGNCEIDKKVYIKLEER